MHFLDPALNGRVVELIMPMYQQQQQQQKSRSSGCVKYLTLLN